MRLRLLVPLSIICVALASAGCRAGDARGEGAGMPPTPVDVDKLGEKTIADYDDYLASLTSRRSITLYPQVSGYVRKIPVKPGDKIAGGALIVAIDPGQQAAALKSIQAGLETKRANLAYAAQNDESSKNLMNEGLLGQLDYQQRHSQRLAAETEVRAAEAQVQAQADLLRFYNITAPSDGTVGDVPVKVGDYVTPQTRLTSVDQDKLIEAYVYVPLTKTGAIKPGSVIQLLDEKGAVLCEEKPTFVAPQVSVDTQTVLVKTICPNEGDLRAAQILTARFVWSRHPGVTVPVPAVSRLAGQYFAFLVERKPEGAVARQKAIEVATIQGNEFVVTKGLSPGDEVIVSNVQKVRDGAPIAPEAPKPASSVPRGASSGQL
jgi:RND family efflux transporter MFP subunit